ncbi:nicotinate-nicotinamide nucleotide adenylyltransferase, partial [candidate division GN15 bacterium]|nr:nicotinate-nicotinamide nucleotide adenylyltransferase [candidate division GN15 bacterium]
MIPEASQSWAVLGGAFDPIHFGHLNLASGALHNAHLDGVVFVPTYSAAHRAEPMTASFLERLAMTYLACEEYDSFEVSDIESELPEPSYSVHTVQALKKQYPGVYWSFLIGAD